VPKSKKERTDWVITKGQLARWQKEKKQRQRAIVIGSVIVAIVLALVIYAIYDSAKSSDPTVLKITGPQGERAFDMDYYVDMLRLYGIQRVAASDERKSKADSTLQAMETNEVFRQLATGLNISVSEQEIQGRIIRDFTPPAGPGTEAPTNPATPTYEESIARFSQSSVYKGASVNRYREVITLEILGGKIQEYISKRDVPNEVEQVNMQGIQIDTAPPPPSPGTSVFTESNAEDIDPQAIYEEIKTRLDAGEDFSALAEEFSASTGASDLEWFPREIATMFYGENIAEAAFTIELDALSEPIPASDAEGNTEYWILRVHQREERPLEEKYRPALESQAFYAWFEGEKIKFSSEIKLDDAGIQEAISKALG